MSTSTRAALGLTAAALAVTGVALATQPGAAAPAKATSHTLKLAAHQTANHNVGKSSFLGADTDRNPKTHEIRGYDSITGHFNLKTHVVKIDAAVALKGGIITAHLHGQGQTNTFDGVLTGGTGKYAGITGTIHATGSGKVTHLTLVYTL